MDNKNIIYCIGDSHVSVFSGSDIIQPIWPEKANDVIPLFRSYRLGPVTAYNLTKTGSSTNGREKLFEVLKTLPHGCNVLLCFGEIDCRVHLLKQSLSQKQPLQTVVQECVDRYFAVVLEVKAMGYNVIVFAAIPSTIDGVIVEQDYAAFGTCQERNNVTKIFNNCLEKKTIDSNVKFLSVFDDLIKIDGLTNFNYYSDRIHLSQKAIPLIVKKMMNVFPNIKINLFKYKVLNKLFYTFQFKLFFILSYLRLYKYKIIKTNNMIKTKILKLINRNKFLADSKSIIDWYRIGQPLPPPHIIKEKIIEHYAKNFKINIFVESGTFLGDMIAAMLNVFKKLYSIELSEDFATKAQKRFFANSNVKIIQGDSGLIITEVLKTLEEPAVFWLDGHFSGGSTAKGSLDTPIYQELTAILQHKIKDHVILIDDARLFTGDNDYPTMNELKTFVDNFSNQLVITNKNDVIRIVKK